MNKRGATEWKKKSIVGKVFYWAIDFPMDLMRLVTIPQFQENNWSRKGFIATPVCTLIFISAACELFHSYVTYYYIWIALYIVAFGLSAFFYVNTYRGTLPKWDKTLLFCAFVMSIFWLWAATNLLMQMLGDMQLLFFKKIPESFLTMTILAIGNSLPDFIVNCSLAKNKMAEMALTGSIGAPAFGILFGFGSSMILKNIKDSDQESLRFQFDLGQTSYKIIVAAMSVITLHIFHLILTVFLGRNKLKRYPTSVIGLFITFV